MRGLFARRRPLLGAALALAALAIGVPVAAFFMRPSLNVAGVRDKAIIGQNALKNLALTVSAQNDKLSNIQVELDGHPITALQFQDKLKVNLNKLEEGPHEIVVRSQGFPLLGSSTVSRQFTVDMSPPQLSVDRPEAKSLDASATLKGSVDSDAKITVGNKRITPDDSGEFSTKISAGATAVVVKATDAAGNTTQQEVAVKVAHPTMRAVHVTAMAWSAPALREPILEMIREKRINTVELDLKDESGEVGYDSQVPLAREIGAVKAHYSAREALDQLHSMGVRVVGRLVAFRDPILAEASWRSGHSQRVIQTAEGTPYTGGYGNFAFTNFANPEVRKYNIDIAVEAAELGFDDILYDYVRRPDGALSRMKFPGLEQTPEESIATFLGESREEVRPHGAYVGASVFGIAATRPLEIAQDIPAIGKQVDYVAPMVYPSHWAPGEYNVANPNAQPYDIVQRSLADFSRALENTDSTVIPWLQDFSLGHTYGAAEVRAQIAASADNGMNSFILWNAACRYHGDALDPS